MSWKSGAWSSAGIVMNTMIQSKAYALPRSLSSDRFGMHYNDPGMKTVKMTVNTGNQAAHSGSENIIV
jgi:hypothetical protein